MPWRKQVTRVFEEVMRFHQAVEFVEGTPLNASDKEKIYHLNAEWWLKIK